MMKTFTSRSLKGIACNASVFAIIILLTLFYSNSYAQTKVFANTVTEIKPFSFSPSHVDNIDNAVSTSDANFATLNSYGGAALGLGAYSGGITLKFPNSIPANKTTYIRIDFDQSALNGLLGGTLGGLVADIVGGLVIGNHNFEVGAQRPAGTTILSRSSAQGFDNNSSIKIVKDKNGYTYIAITPNEIYDKVYIIDRTTGLLLTTTGKTNVYYAYTIDGNDNCDANVYANYDEQGISLDALNLAGAENFEFQKVIDNDKNTFYSLSTGVVGVAASKSINVYFPTLSNTTDNFNLRLRTSPALVNLKLFDNLMVTAYNGTTPVYSAAASSLLGLDLLGLLNNGQVVTVPFAPGVAFDRVTISLSTLVSANVTQYVEIYDISRSPAFPTFTLPISNTVNACYNTSANLQATTAAGNQLVWYDVADGGTALATVAYNAGFPTPLLTANKTYYVSAKRADCTLESVRVPVNVVVNPQIIFNGATLGNATPGFAYSKQLDVATGGTAGYTYALAAGSTLPTGLVLSSTGSITGTATIPNTYNFSVVATDTKNCTATAAYTLTVTPALALTPGALPDGITGTLYPTRTIPAATGGTGPYTYTATGVPAGLTFNPTTREITGTPTVPGVYTIPVTVVDANGNTVTSNYTVKITDPFLLPPATLASGVTGTVYTTQIIPSATGGTTPYTYTATGLPPGLVFNETTREITGTPTAVGTFVVPVTAKDGDNRTVTTNYSITITDPLVLPAANLPDGNEGAVYATQILPAATGGVGPYTYVGSSLPAGLSFNPLTREITGTPTQAGNYSIGVTVTDSQNKTASNTYAIKVIGTLTLPTRTLPDGVVGTSYLPQTLPAVTGGTAPYTYAATGLPPGLTFDNTTREISGTPTQGGTFTVSLTATDANQNKATTAYTITVTVNAPVVASTTVCSGSTATLTVSNVQAVTYNLYGATGSSPLATNTTGIFVTPIVTSSTVFYVEAVSGTAVSTRTSVTVSVNPAATLATVTTNNQVINTGQSTTLSATADAGNTITWFDAATGGTQVGTGNSFTTPSLTTTTTYYVQTNSAAGCPSATRVPVTVTVITGGGSTACNAANTQNSGINGICLLCGITGAGNSTDADGSNFTRITLAVGVGATGYQQLIFPSAGVATDSLRLDLALPSGLADVGVLNNITVRILNGASVVRTVTINSALLNLTLLGGNRFTATVLAGGVYDRVEVSFGAVVSALTSLDIYGATIVYPNPTLTAGAQSICSGTTATLTATANGGTTLTWFDAATGGTQVGSGASFTTPALTTTTTYYIQVSKGTCANTTRVPVVVTVNPAIIFAGTTLTNATISSPYSKQLPVATGGTPGYTYALASGSTLPAGLTLSSTGLVSGTPTATGNPTFSVVATDTKNCSTTAVFTLAVTPALALAPGALPDGVTGTPYTTNGIPAATGGTGPYTYSATGVPPGLTFNPTTREITGTPTQIGNYTIPVTVVDANGNTITSNYTLKVTDPLVLPAATLANGTTGTVYTTQIIPSATGGTTPYTYSATGLPAGLSFNITTREITGTPTQSGTFTFPVTVVDDAGKTATTNYTITVIDPLTLPGASLPDGTEATVYATQTLPSAVGGVGPYTYVASNLPAGLNFDPITRELSGTPTQAGNYSIGITATDSQNRTASNTYAIKIIGVLSLPGATLPDGIVGTSYPTQTLPAVTGGTSPYTYVATNLPPGLSFNTTTREITGTPTLGGTFIISLTATDANQNKATTAYSLTVTVNPPVVASATVCSGSAATLSVSNLQAGVTYNWYASTGSTPLATNNTGVFVTPAVSAQTIFYVEAISGTAVSSRTAVTVSVNPPANLATVTTNNQVINAGQSTTLSATADAGNTISWYTTPAGGASVATGGSFTTPALSTTTTYYVETTTAAGCASATRVPVIVTVINGGGGTACNAANSQNTSITGICLLCQIAGAGNSTDADANNFTRISLAVGVGSTGIQQLIFPSVGAATDSIRLDLALPGGLLDLTALGNVTVRVMNGTATVRTVQLNSSLLNLQLLSGNRFLATVLAGGAYDRVQVSFGALATVLTSLDIYGATVIYPDPTVTAGNQTICSGSTATLTATANGGTTLAWFDAATGGTQLATGATFTTPALTATTTYYIQVSKGTCANTTRVPVIVTVTPALPAPVLATIASVCSGSSATISIANPDAAVTYKWYDAAANGTLVFTGSVFATPALTANTTYYVEAVQGNCVSATRTAAAVTVNPRPALPVVTANTSTISAGQTAIITATSADATNTFNWYNSPSAITPIYSGSTYVTPPLTVTTTYYVEAVSTNGCSSASRVQITITVDGNGSPNPVPCEAASTQTGGVTGVALLAGLFNPTLAIDNDTQTASSLVMPVGALNASVFQRVGFGSLSKVGDTVRVLVSTPGKLLSLALLGNASVTTYVGTSSNGDARFLNNSLLNVQLLSGNTQALITFVPTSVFDGVEVRINSGVLGALTSIDFNYAQRILVAPTVASSNVSACVGSTAQLEVSNPSSALTYRWYDSAGNYLSGKDGVIFTTPVLTGDTKFFVAAVSATGCVSYKTVVNVTTSPAPVAPTLLSAAVNTCPNTSVTLQVSNPIVGSTYNWYDTATSTSILFSGTTFTTPLITANRSYFVAAVNACGTLSSRTEATITLGTIDIPVITPPSITITQGSVAVLKATSSTAGSTINWYDAATGGNLLFTGETFVTPQLSATTTYYVEANVAGGCTATSRASVTVTVIPNGGPITTPCGTATSTVASGVNGIAIGAAVVNPTFAVDNNINTGSSLVIPVGLLGASVYHQVGFPALSNVGDTLRLKITVPAQLLSVALLQNLTVTTFQGASSNNDGVSVSNPLITLRLLTGGSTAILTYVPTSRFDGVELRLGSGILGALTSINFDYAQRTITAPTVASATASACQGSSATLNVSNPQAGIIYKWYLGTTYQAGKDGATFVTDPALTAGTYVYSVTATATATGCESPKTEVTVTILPPPAAPIPSTTNPATTCINTPATLSVQAVAGITYNWYDAATNGNMLVNNNSSFTTSASLAAGTYDYYVEAVNGNSCANPTRTKVSITVNPSAIASDITVSGNSTLCASGTTTLTATSATVTNPIFTWYTDAALTNVAFVGSVFNTPAIATTTKYYVTVSGTNKCANAAGNSKEVTITVNPIAVATDINLAGTSTVCGGSSVTISASSTTVTNPIFTWYSNANLSTPVFTGAVFVTPTLTATTTYYVTVKGDNKCENSAATAKSITITVNPAATDADITASGTTVCKGSTAALSAATTTVVNPIFTWYSNAALTTVAHVGANFTTPALSVTTTYYVTVKGDNKCENSAANAKVVTVTVNEFATAADITVSNAQICAGSSVILMASSTTVTQPVFTWYSDASLTTAVFTGPSFTVTGLTSTTTYYVTVKGTNKCENAAADAKVVTVIVNPLATTTDIIVNGSTVACSGSSATLTASSTTVTSPIFTWYSDAALTNVSFVGAIFTTPALTSTTTYYVTVKGTNKCENAPGTGKQVTITVSPVAVAADIAAADATICSGSTATLAASSTTVTNPVFSWYNDANLTSVAFVGASFTTPILTATKAYYVTVKGDNKCENSASTAKVVTVNVNTGATAADITLSTPAIVCGSGTAVINASSTTVTNPIFTWYNDASLTSVAFTGPIFTTPTLTNTTTYYLTVKGSNRCENTAATAKAVTITVNPIAIASDIIVNGSTNICGGSATVLTATSTTVTSPVFTWYSDAALTNSVFVGSVFTTPTLTANATYYVTVKGANKCENTASTAKSVSIVVNTVASSTDVAASDATICAGSTASLVATTITVTNPIFSWYSDAALSTKVFTGATFVTPALTATTKYYLTVKGDNRCESSASTAKVVTVNVNAGATAADITLSTPAIVCGSGTSVINANSTTVTNPIFTWYNDASLTSVAFTGPIFTTPNLTATTTYYVTVKGSDKCENNAANAKAVTITVNPIAIASDIIVNGSTNICGGSTAVLTATSTTVTSPVFTWYSDAALTNAVFVGSVFTTPTLTANTNYYVTVKGSNKCENTAATAKSVSIVVNSIATSTDVAASDANICAGSTASLVASTATVTNPIFSWYSDAALTTKVFTGATFVTPALTATTKYYLTVKGDNRCESSAANAKVVTVNVNTVATAADITLSTPARICGTGTVVINASSTTVINPVFTWYNDASLTSVAFTGSTFTTPTLTTTTTYYVTVKGSNRCENTAANVKTVTVIVSPIAVATDISVSGATSICSNVAAVLTASSTTVTNPIFTWYSNANLTTSIFTGATFTTPVLTATTTYYVTVKGDNKCENSPATARVVTVTVNATPNNPIVSNAGTNICAGDVTTLIISNAQSGVTYEWYNAATGGNVLFTGSSYTTPILTATTDYYILAIGAGGCNNSGGRVKVTVTVNPKPTVPTVASSSVSVCTGSTAVLTVTSPQTGVVYNWYTTPTGGTIVGTGTNFTTPPVTANGTYYVEGTNGSCTSASRTPVNVIALPVPTAPASATAANGTICAGSTTILTVNNPTTGLIYRWYAASSGGTMLAEGVTFTTPALTTSTTYYVESIAVGGCASPTRTAVAVTVLPVLARPVVVVQETTINSVNFAWSPVSGATAYEVSLDNGSTWVNPTNGSTGTSYLVIGLKPDQSVTIIVRARGQIDCQTSANSVPVTGKATNPFGNQIFIPNAFTPNNDGKNDIFLIFGNTIASSKMSIYTQWGQLIFQSDNMATGWDGTFKGINQPIGVYVYMVEVTFSDGTTTMRKGTVTLIR
ncbi:T9SS type B sorting domain-containing protein [Pedobacter frigidisoli]|uniref:T9SS type B sorting domain-containing protein n=1 Tax=Pedobacter frigidisoli TaxID=2530455 RepID=A0A4R0P930_9SPHI|nr:putative Ig domain-containing protein [Pedobacter frigidisoli]TCD12507.1 T9SS type B sorting domain-containing protein [Pedobacter frigidisoli]